MADNELESIINEPSEADKRIKQLSGIARQNAEEAEKARADAAEKARIAEEASRERDFYKGFADVVSTTPAARDFQDDILTKVKSGYSMEDATFAVLGRAGKLGNSAPVVSEAVAGGSAPTNPPDQTEKSVSEMSLEEKRALLMENDDAIRNLLRRTL